MDDLRIYTDGSDIDGGVGAAAVLYTADNDREPASVLHCHLGATDKHTVYEAEIVATILAAELLQKARNPTDNASIALDNVAAIRAAEAKDPRPSHYLTDAFADSIRDAKRTKSYSTITLRWVPGHMDVAGNECADMEAKKAARGLTSPVNDLPKPLRHPLPTSSAAAKRAHVAKLKIEAANTWKTSRRGRRTMEVD